MADTFTRADVVAAARSWIGTPYHHQASVRGIGADCLGLVRGVWRDLYGCDAETPPPYTRDWAEALGRETLIEAAGRHLAAVAVAERRAGDIVIFRYRPGAPAKHVAILTAPDAFVHAMEGVPVEHAALSPWWRRRIAAVFAFPGVGD